MSEWAVLARRTNDPKLAYLEYLLDEAGIDNRRHGWSFHAPILEVRGSLREAWEILAPIDDIPDDDPQFEGSEELRDKCRLEEYCDEMGELRKAGLNHRGEP